MKIKRSLFSFLIVSTMFLCACQQKGYDYSAWIPDHDISELNLDEDKGISVSTRVIPDKSEYTAIDELAKRLLNHEDISEALYKNQLINGAYEDLSEVISEKRTIIYVSSSEGNNLNDGRTPNTPKKTFEELDGNAGIAVLLKCGDTFEMTDVFYVGDNSVICSYGEGPRPKLDFTRKIEEEFVSVRGYENVWAVDLSRTDYNKDKSGNQNYNIGQLFIDGECNWNRVMVADTDIALFDFPGTISSKKDSCWIVDWMHGVLYLYSESNPNEHEIRAAVGQQGFNFKEIRNAIVSDLEIIGVGYNGCKIANCTNISVRNCTFRYIGGAAVSDSNRNGNGINLSGVENGVKIENNVFDWVYDCGYVNSGLTVTDKQEKVTVSGNIFSHCRCGIAQKGDFQCLVPISKFEITNNLVFCVCDVTNPTQPMYADTNGLLTGGITDYRTYRGEGDYEKISSLVLSAVQVPGEFNFTGNVFWQTNRLLARIDAAYGFPEITNNHFFSGIGTERDCLFAYYITNEDTVTTTYVNRLLEDNNTESVVTKPSDSGDNDVSYISNEDLGYLINVLKSIAGE